MSLEINQVLTEDFIKIVDDKGNPVEVSIWGLNEPSRNTLREFMKFFNKKQDGQLTVADQKEMYKHKSINPYIKDKLLTNEEIDNLRVKFFHKKHAAGDSAKKINNRIQKYIKALGDQKEEVGKSAARALAKMGPVAISALTKALEDGNPRVRYSACFAFYDSVCMGPGVRAAVPALIKLFNYKEEEEYPRTRFAAYVALVNVYFQAKDTAKDIVPAFIKLFGDKNEQLRRDAAEALAEMGPVAVPELITALDNKDSNVRYHAAQALYRLSQRTDEGSSEAEKALPALKKIANDRWEYPSVKEMANKAICAIEGK